jgi:hypothetical protein
VTTTPGASSHGRSAPDACSVVFDREGLSAYGTAARASFFVALEQPGPWGRDAARQSHLDPDIGATLSDACGTRGGRLTLLRRPGRHPDEHHAGGPAPGQKGDGHAGGGHTAYLAWAGTDAWLLELTVTDPAALLELDLDALARGDRDAVVASAPDSRPAEPVMLVCTNGRRDVCCAVRGRPVALDAMAVRPGRVWEASHTGGHRFAPTGVLLPHGVTLARLDAEQVAQVLDTASSGHLPSRLLGPVHDRGRSELDPDAQAAESHVRHEHVITELGALATSPAGPAGRYAVRHRDGRSWTVEVDRADAGTLAESCAKTAVAVTVRRPRLVR